jgi:hypothetical protein
VIVNSPRKACQGLDGAVTVSWSSSGAWSTKKRLENSLPKPLTPEWWVQQLDTAHGLTPMPQAFAERPCHGVSRLYYNGEERPDRILTCFWRPGGVWAEALQAWCIREGGPRQVPPVSRWSAEIPRHFLPECLRNWDMLRRSFELAPSCNREQGLVASATCTLSLVSTRSGSSNGFGQTNAWTTSSGNTSGHMGGSGSSAGCAPPCPVSPPKENKVTDSQKLERETLIVACCSATIPGRLLP